MDVHEYLVWAKDYIEEHYFKILDEIERDFRVPIKRTMGKGKRFRPSLTLLCCQACGGKPENAIDHAIAMELVHNASLAHDDVLDKDKYRRADNALWVLASVGKAILAGDAGFAKALHLISKYGSRIMSASVQAVYALARGAVKESVDKLPSLDSTEPYLEIANLKTASLFATACQIGAIAAYAPPYYEEACRLYGKYIGLAYQLADDHVDLVKTIKTGDPHGDIKDHRVTYPLFCIYLTKERIKRLLPLFAAGDIEMEQFLEAIQNSEEGLNKSMAKIKEFADMAKKEARKLPESEYRDIMIELPDVMIDAMLDEIEQLEKKESE